MPSRVRAAPKRGTGKPTGKKKAAPAKTSGAAKKVAAKAVPANKRPAGRGVPSTPSTAATAAKAPSSPQPVRPTIGAAVPAAAGKPAVRQTSVGQAATEQQAEERRKAATRKLFARIRSIEAILGADLRKRGSLLLSQAVDQWYAEAISATATDVSITNAARTVISQL